MKNVIKMKNKAIKATKKLKITKKLYQLIFWLVGLLPKRKKSIVFESFLGKQYSCNPRAIYEYIDEHYKDYTCYWSIDHRYKKNYSGFELNLLRRFSIKWLIVMARSKYWVSNSRLPLWIPKPKKTVYLQTWHGTPLKKLALDMDEVYMPGTDTKKYKKNFKNESKRWDYLISPNPYSSEIFARAFDFDGKIIETGYPRNDFLVNYSEENIDAIKRNINIPMGKKVLLYAPTWRDDEFHQKGRYKFNLRLDLQEMQRQLGDEYVVLLRLHYLIAENLDLSEFNNFIFDVSNYPDIRDLYIVSDALITDYSSVFFDYSLLKRPIIFFVYDIDNYRDKLRGFYINFNEEAPGPLVKTTNGVIEQIKLLIQKKQVSDKSVNSFIAKYNGLEDGEASRRVVEKVFR